MYQLSLLLVGIVGVFAAPRNEPTDNRVAIMLEMKDFMVALPMQRIYNTLLDHLNNDEEMQAGLKYIKSKEYQREVRALAARPSVKELKMNYIEAGLDIERYEKIVNDILSGLAISVPEDTNRSFGNILADLDKLMPYEKLMDILSKKLENSPVFIRFFNAITTHEMHMLFEKMMNSPEYKRIAQDLEDMDVPIPQYVDVVFSIFGWKKQETNNDL